MTKAGAANLPDFPVIPLSGTSTGTRSHKSPPRNRIQIHLQLLPLLLLPLALLPLFNRALYRKVYVQGR